jgi:FG-GAP-like repeat
MHTKNTTLFALLLLLATSSTAAVFIVPSDREMVRRADAIALATATRSYAQPTAAGGIETVTSFDVTETIKGELPPIIDVHEPGGVFGGRALIIPGVPRFADGERVLLFLSRTPRGTWAVTEIAAGKFNFARDRAGRRLLARTEADIVGWDPNGAPHREPHRDAERFLQFLRAEAGGGMGRVDYEVPYAPLTDLAPSAKSLPVIPANAPYSATSYTSLVGNNLGARWNVFPAAVPWYTGNGSSQTAINGTTTAMASWNNDPSSNIAYTYNGNDSCGCHTTGLAGADNMNTVLFERNLSQYGIGAFQCSGNTYSGTLGIGGITSTSSQHAGPNGESFWTTREADVEMNVGVLACSSLINNGGFASGITHEVGHTLGFRHSDQTRANNPSVPCSSDPSLECSGSAIMTSAVPFGLNAQLQLWDQHAANAVYPGTSTPPPTPLSHIKDFNGDGRSDVLWRNSATGEAVAWFLTNARFVGGASLGAADLNWRLVGASDFNRDGRIDLVWRNGATGANVVWFMNGTTLTSSASLPSATDLNWNIEATADFNGDGWPDIVFHHHGTGRVAIWLMNGTTRSSAADVGAASDLNWHIVGAGDFNSDGNTDIAWRHAANGSNVFWRMNGVTLVGGVEVDRLIDPNWQITGVADYNNNGTPDFFWHNRANGNNAIWYINNFAFAGGAAVDGLPDLRWQGAGPR